MTTKNTTPEKAEGKAFLAAEGEDRILTVPNLMSFFRLLLIPLIIWVYLKIQKYWLVAALLLLSGATDVADGYVARHFHQVSNLGKMLDPVADKFTEGIMMILLALRYPLLWAVVGLFVIHAVLLSYWGIRAINHQEGVTMARWWGKVTTVLLYLVTLALLFFPDIPRTAANAMIILCGIAVTGNMTAYGLFYRKQTRASKERAEHEAENASAPEVTVR